VAAVARPSDPAGWRRSAVVPGVVDDDDDYDDGRLDRRARPGRADGRTGVRDPGPSWPPPAKWPVAAAATRSDDANWAAAEAESARLIRRGRFRGEIRQRRRFRPLARGAGSRHGSRVESRDHRRRRCCP
jgi:hypothetical protein